MRLQAMLYCCCGLDVHKDMIEACILSGVGELPQIYRCRFSTSKSGLRELCRWLTDYDCYSVAMESTSIYWMPVYEALETGLPYFENLFVVNANHMHNVPGRKSDVADAEWIASLFRNGLLEKSFVPNQEIRDLREHSRLCRTLIRDRVNYSNRLEKFLQRHSLKFSSIMKDILCVSGRALLNILAEHGTITQTDVEQNCRRLRTPFEEICDAICGSLNCDEQHLLKILLNRIDSLQTDIDELQSYMRQMTAKYERQIELISSIPGVKESSAIEIIAEITQKPQEHFQTSGHLCKWVGVVPRNDGSADTIKSRKILHGNSYLKPLLVQLAWAAARTRNSYFSSWFWSHKGKLGEKKAIIAVSRKLLKLIYYLLEHDILYDRETANSALS